MIKAVEWTGRPLRLWSSSGTWRVTLAACFAAAAVAATGAVMGPQWLAVMAGTIGSCLVAITLLRHIDGALFAFSLVNLASLVNYTEAQSLASDAPADAIGLLRVVVRVGVNVIVAFWTLSVLHSRPSRSVALAVGSLLILTLPSVIFAGNVAVSLGRWVDLAAFLCASLGVVGIAHDIPLAIRRSLAWALLTGLLTLFAWWFVDPGPLTRQVTSDAGVLSRFGGSVVPPNTLGAVGVSLCVLAIVCLVEGPRLSRWTLALGVPVGAATVLASGSRTALIALVVAMVLIVGAQLVRGGAKASLLSVLVILVALATSIAISDTAVGFSYLSGTASSIDTLSGRIEIWPQVLSQWTSSLQSLLIGGGFGQLASPVQVASLVTTSAHDGYLQVLAGSGAFGFVGYGVMWVTLLVLVCQSPTRVPLLALFAVLALHNVTEIGAFATLNPMTVIAIALLGYANHPAELPKSSGLG